MTIYWVDPHIGALVQANGTSDTTTRDGTYSAPWSLADISSTSQTTLPTKMTPLVSGDEIRFKGLPINTYTIELPNTTFRITAAFNNTTVNSFRSNNATDAALITDYVGTGATIWPRMLYVSSIPALGGSSGFIPIYYIQNAGPYINLEGGSTWNPGYGYTMMGSEEFSGRIVKYKEYGIDINTLIGSSARILPRLPDGVSVTAGWTSDTVRDGVTLLLLWSSATSNTYWCYQSSTYASTTGSYDCPELYLLHGSKGSNSIQGNFYVGPGGPNQTHRLGGCANSYSPGTAFSVYTVPGATLDINYMYSCAYGTNYSGNIYTAGSLYSTLIVRNLVSTYNPTNSFSGNYVNFKIGNVHAGNNASNSFPLTISASTSVGAPVYEILENSIFSAYGSATQHLAFMSAVPATITVPATVTNTFATRITGVGSYPGTSDRPVAIYSVTSRGLVSQGLNSSFSQSKSLATAVTNINEGMYYIGELDTGGIDYKTVSNSTIFDSSTTAHASDLSRSYVYQSNSYDGRPVMMMISADNAPCFLYNDSTKNEALTWHQFVESNAKYFQKDIPVPIPTYTTEQVNFQAVYSTSAAFNGSMVIEFWTVNSQTGVPTLQASVSVTTGSLSDSQMNAVLTNSTLTTNNIKTAYLRMKFTGGSTGAQKFWLQSVTAVLPTP